MLTFLSRTNFRFPSRCAPFAPVLDVPASDHTRDVVASGSKVDGLFLKETWQPFQSDSSPLLQLRRMNFTTMKVLSSMNEEWSAG
jgi:hypothetical protein